MNKNKLEIIFLTVCLALLMLVGCEENKVIDTTGKMEAEVVEKLKIKMDDFMNMNEENVVISLDKFDYFFYKNTSSVTTISFDIYSLKELEEKNIDVSLEAACPYSVEVLKQEDEKLELFNLMTYMGVDWKELYRMMIEETDKFEELTDAYSKQYDKLKEVPVLHSYNVCVQFDMTGPEFSEENISEIEVSVDGKTYKINAGNIVLNREFQLDREYEGIELNSFSYFEIPFDINQDGTTVLPEYSFVAKEKIRIDDFKISHPDFNIQSFELQVEENGNVRNEKITDLKGIEIEEGANVTIYATVQSNKLAESFSYGASGLQIMEYTLLKENIPQKAFNEFIIRTRLRAFDFYGHYVDNIDTLSYYYDYYNPIYEY